MKGSLLTPVSFFGRALIPRRPLADAVPRLYVVVDTEAEFDWNKPFSRDAIGVSAVRHVGRAQDIFDRNGLRPIYVVDHAIATQPDGFGPIRAILDRGACMIGAHLHPWINPPFGEAVTERNSFPGNLPPALEEAKLRTLIAAIRDAFGVDPPFFKAGRYGLGPNTFDILQRLGITVDLSILPGADYRRTGGPVMLAFQPVPYDVTGTDIVSYPITRAFYGPASFISPAVQRALFSSWSRRISVPGLLARSGLLNHCTLSPEYYPAKEQKRLIQVQLQRGQREFFLAFHSPSLEPGHTPYVRDQAELAEFLNRIEQVLEFFMHKIGGLPGNPADLLRRSRTANRH